jgi:hypothetical protein
MTGDIQPNQKKRPILNKVGCNDLKCAIDSRRGTQEVVLSATNTVSARSMPFDNFIGVVDSPPKDARVGVRMIFLLETFGSSSNGTTLLVQMELRKTNRKFHKWHAYFRSSSN